MSSTEILVTAAKKAGCKNFSKNACPEIAGLDFDGHKLNYSEALNNTTEKEVRDLCRTMLKERRARAEKLAGKKPAKPSKKTVRKTPKSPKAATKKKKRA